MRKRATSELPIYRPTLSRRSVIVGLPLLVAACAGSGRLALDPSLLRQEVSWRGRERPGSIVTIVPERRLDLVQGNGRALRYAVGVGRTEALNFHGSAVIGRKETWPRWTPTAHMMAAIPHRPYAGGIDGGPDNSLGARALYFYRNGRDTYFRLHGTNEPESIGHAVSRGCFRLLNEDIR
jgi:lipoprotein-anchoring transpeptidase ErfK/SrfK